MLGQGGFELMTFRSPDKNAVPEPNLKGSPRKNNCIFQLSKGKHFPPSLIEGDSCPLGFAACFAWRGHSFLNLYGTSTRSFFLRNNSNPEFPIQYQKLSNCTIHS